MELFKGQKYANIRKEQTEYGVPWTDPTFPPSDTSIGHSKSSKLPRVVKWLRPSVSDFLSIRSMTMLDLKVSIVI